VFLQFDSTTADNRVLLYKHLVLDTSGAVTSQVDMAVTTASTKDFTLTSGANVDVAFDDGSTLTVAQGGEERVAVNGDGEVRLTSAADQDVLITRCVGMGRDGLAWKEGCSGVGRRRMTEVIVVSTCRTCDAAARRRKARVHGLN
jgi:hypothetical protein